ncbi:MAG: MATE family efflux transporter [Pacificimonas sp.]|jgi:putative MATE family efflux protein|nr:MATE family efflux transporter [Pacificimonas sp.]
MSDRPNSGQPEFELLAPGSDARDVGTLEGSGAPTGDRDRKLIEGAIIPTLTVFALPLFTTNILHAFAGTWSAAWVARTLGPDALIAVVNGNVFMFTLMGAVMGIGAAAGIAIGQAFGAGDHAAVKRTVGTAISSVFGFSIVLAAAGWWSAPFLLDLIRMPPSAYDDALTFIRWTCLALPTMFTFISMMMMLRGRGDARTPFIFSCIWIGISAALVPLLITGSYGAPDMGIAGAAIGNLAGNSVALISLIAFVYRRNLPIAIRRGEFANFIPDPAIVLTLVKKGAPMAAEMLIVQGAYFVLLGMVNGYGATVAAAYSAAAQLWGYVQMPAIAFGASISAMAAQNIGADRWDRVSQIALRGTALSVAATGAVCALVYLLGDLPLLLFLPKGGETLEIARHINDVILWCWIVLAVTTAMSGIVRANGAMIPPTMIYLITMWVLRIPFARGLQPWLGEDAIWWSFPLGAVASAVLAALYYRYGQWRENDLMVARR